jgi:hypothetical protein
MLPIVAGLRFVINMACLTHGCVVQIWYALSYQPSDPDRKGASAMPLTRSFRETVQARARRDIKFRQALLDEAMQALLDGDLEYGRAALRSYIRVTSGFAVV